ncbi:MAG: hypothetical protein WDO24_10455 [Pseudomonadota bacterium]
MAGSQGLQDGTFIAAAGFQDRVGCPARLQPSDEILSAFGCLIEPGRSIPRFEGDIAPIFADVDPGIEWL